MADILDLLDEEIRNRENKIEKLKKEIDSILTTHGILQGISVESEMSTPVSKEDKDIKFVVKKDDSTERNSDILKGRITNIIMNGFATSTFTTGEISAIIGSDYNINAIRKVMVELVKDGFVNKFGNGPSTEYCMKLQQVGERPDEEEYLKKKQEGWKEKDSSEGKSAVLAKRILKCFETIEDNEGISLPEIMDVLKDEISMDRATYYNAMAKLETEKKVSKSKEKINGRGSNGRPAYVYTIMEG